MPIGSMPAIDQPSCSGWVENDIALYNSLPFYFAKQQVERRKTWATWNKRLKKKKWTANMGNLMKGIYTEPSPHLRQFASPNPMASMPNKDIADIREVTNQAQLYRHRFESPVLNFLPSFNDFMDHVDDYSKDIMEKEERFEDIYLRGNIFQMSPFVFVATGNTVALVNAPAWSGTGIFNSATDGKTAAWLQAIVNTPGISGLTISSVIHALTIAETELRVPFFAGDSLPSEDKALSGKYLLRTSAEAYNQFTFDPYVKENKNCAFDIVNNQFHGSIIGRITTELEDLPLRFKADGTFPPPETRIISSDPLEANMTVPNSDYSSPATAPYEVGFFVGAEAYQALEVGPPPAKFTGDSPPHNFPSMFWNAEVRMTKKFLVPCVDSTTGNVIYEANTYGEHLKFICQVALGILPVKRRNIIPFIYMRKRGA